MNSHGVADHMPVEQMQFFHIIIKNNMLNCKSIRDKLNARKDVGG